MGCFKWKGSCSLCPYLEYDCSMENEEVYIRKTEKKKLKKMKNKEEK